MQKVLNGTLPSLASCFAAGSGSGAGLTFDADPSGHARNVKVTGVNAETERCVSSIVSGVRLPDFQGAAVPVQFPLSIYRPAAAPIAAPVAPPAPAAAPVFIKP